MDQRRARRPGPRSGRVGSDSRSSSSEDKTEAVPSLLSDDDAGLARRRAVRVGTSKMFSNLNFVPAECGPGRGPRVLKVGDSESDSQSGQAKLYRHTGVRISEGARTCLRSLGSFSRPRPLANAFTK